MTQATSETFPCPSTNAIFFGSCYNSPCQRSDSWWRTIDDALFAFGNNKATRERGDKRCARTQGNKLVLDHARGQNAGADVAICCR